MSLLILGVVLWSAAHLFPALLPAPRTRLIAILGDGAYRGMFALIIVTAIALMVIGWRSAEISAVYRPPLYASPIVTAMVLLSFILFGAAKAPGNIKRFLRHPMLMGLAVWAGAHLLANGDNRSVALFGGLGLWAIVMMIAINLRDGAWEKPAAAPVTRDLGTIVVSAILFAAVIYFHASIFGVSPLPLM